MSRDGARAALHALVDMLDTHPDLPAPELSDSVIVPKSDDIEALIREMAPCSIVPTANPAYVKVVRDFGGGIKYQLFVEVGRLGEPHTETREVTEWRLRPSVEAALRGEATTR